jgi:hypothetical protein
MRSPFWMLAHTQARFGGRWERDLQEDPLSGACFRDPDALVPLDFSTLRSLIAKLIGLDP